MLPLDQPDQRGGRTGPRADGACVRLAAGPRRLAADRRGHGLTSARAGRRDRHLAPGRDDCRAPAEHGGPVRSHPAPGPWDRRLPAAGRLPAPAGSLPLRAGSLQARLGPRRADSLARRELRRRGHGAPRRHARGDRPLRGRGLAWPPSGASLRAARPTEPVRPDAGARRTSTPRGPTVMCRAALRGT